METRGSHILIGSAVLLFTLLFMGLVIWVSGSDLDDETRSYDIYFRGSVSGLATGGDVRYRGIRIGRVGDIEIDSDDPSQVRATVEISNNLVIKEGDVARLKLQGITGVAFVSIEGAVAGSPPLGTPPLAKRPIIPSAPSELEKLFSGAPELLGRAIVVTERLADLLGEDNQAQFAGILADLKVLTGTLASQQAGIANTLQAMERSAASVASAASKADALIDDMAETMSVARGAMIGIDQTVSRDLGALIAELRATNQDMAGVMASANRIVQRAEEPLVGFTQDGLGEAQRFITEARLMVAAISRLTERLETGGAQTLLGVEGAEVDAQ
ncbi:MAG: MlaD family protein [Minwuia sp.]|nr:MlaD family protein [Minwuia sp.]